MFAGRVEKSEGHGSVEWAIAWVNADRFLNSYCNTVPTPDGGTHEAGLRAALTKGLRAYGELAGVKRVSQITARAAHEPRGVLEFCAIHRSLGSASRNS
jgi:topoisomerase-4 subunit B